MQHGSVVGNALFFVLAFKAKMPAKREGVKIKAVQGA